MSFADAHEWSVVKTDDNVKIYAIVFTRWPIGTSLTLVMKLQPYKMTYAVLRQLLSTRRP